MIAQANNIHAAAYHESGHACVAVLMAPAVRLVAVEIHARGTGEFQCSRVVSRGGADAYGLTLAAGREAEILAGQSEEGASSAAEDDAVALELMMDAMGLVGEQRAHQVERWRHRAEGLLLLNWRCVEQVAAALRVHRKLTGEQVREIVQRTRR